MPYDILNDPFIEVAGPGGPDLLTLPDLLEAWGRGDDISLAGTRRHQKAALHMFLVQAAVGAHSIAADGGTMEAPAADWKTRLLSIAPAGAWHLVVDDETKPALMQSPLPAGTVSKFNAVDTADALTVLVTAKNHSMKQNLVSVGSPWTWLCALIELQTLSGYSGKFNYGSVKMNGGLGSRPLVAFYPDMRDGPRWLRDAKRYAEFLETGQNSDVLIGNLSGIVATWVPRWNGVEQIALSELHPTFIEVSRRVRLVETRGVIAARTGTSQANRISAAKELKGRTGDPWAPRDGEDKILTVSSTGWNLERVKNLIVRDGSSAYLPSEFMAFLPTDKGDMFFHASVITGGQGKTEGFHEITLPIPSAVVGGILARASRTASVGKTASLMSTDADTTRSILRRSLQAFMKGGAPPGEKADSKPVDVWTDSLRAKVMDAFFPSLWETESEPDRGSWRKFLRDTADELFEEATKSLPTRGELYFQAHAMGKRLLMGSLKRAFLNPAETTTKGALK